MPRAGGCRSPGVRHQQLEPRTGKGGTARPCCLCTAQNWWFFFWFHHLPQTFPHAASLTGETGGCCLGQPRHYKQNELHGHQACPEGSVQPGHPWSCSNSALHPGSPCVGFVPTERGAQARSLTCVQKAGAWPEGGGLVQHNHH